jgi:hypothetical protein
MTTIAGVGPNLPLDLLQATGRYGGPLPLEPERETPRANAWLESKFAPWAFPLLEAWAEGSHDGLENVVFSRGDDTSHRLYYYICELRRQGLIGGPEPLVFDVAKIGRSSSIERTVDEVRRLARTLEVGSNELEAAIAASNRKRAESALHGQGGGRACLLAGTPTPDRRLHQVITRAGFVPFGPTLAESWSGLGARIDENSGDPEAAIGRQLHADPDGPRSMADPADRLRTRLGQAPFAAVILWRIEQDEAAAWHMPAQYDVLENSGVPHLVLTRRDWLARDGAPDEISAFLGGVAA